MICRAPVSNQNKVVSQSRIARLGSEVDGVSETGVTGGEYGSLMARSREAKRWGGTKSTHAGNPHRRAQQDAERPQSPAGNRRRSRLLADRCIVRSGVIQVAPESIAGNQTGAPATRERLLFQPKLNRG